MFVELAVGYFDTSASELGWSVDLGPQAALATRRMRLGAFHADLRLLGASHQLAVWSDAVSSEPQCLETVACLPEQTVPLPKAAERDLGGWTYTFASAVSSYSPARFDRRVASVEARAAQGLVGHYPGAPGALTAIYVLLTESGLRWSTWHTYPQKREIAMTRSSLRRAPLRGRRCS